MVLSAACAFFTPAGLPGASGAAAFVPAKALEASRLVARMAAPIVRIGNSSNILSALHFSTQPTPALSMKLVNKARLQAPLTIFDEHHLSNAELWYQLQPFDLKDNLWPIYIP
jgi:hypothetical protein